jgi:hypothetical protein
MVSKEHLAVAQADTRSVTYAKMAFKDLQFILLMTRLGITDSSVLVTPAHQAILGEKFEMSYQVLQQGQLQQLVESESHSDWKGAKPEWAYALGQEKAGSPKKFYEWIKNLSESVGGIGLNSHRQQEFVQEETSKDSKQEKSKPLLQKVKEGIDWANEYLDLANLYEIARKKMTQKYLDNVENEGWTKKYLDYEPLKKWASESESYDSSSFGTILSVMAGSWEFENVLGDKRTIPLSLKDLMKAGIVEVAKGLAEHATKVVMDADTFATPILAIPRYYLGQVKRIKKKLATQWKQTTGKMDPKDIQNRQDIVDSFLGMDGVLMCANIENGEIQDQLDGPWLSLTNDNEKCDSFPMNNKIRVFPIFKKEFIQHVLINQYVHKNFVDEQCPTEYQKKSDLPDFGEYIETAKPNKSVSFLWQQLDVKKDLDRVLHDLNVLLDLGALRYRPRKVLGHKALGHFGSESLEDQVQSKFAEYKDEFESEIWYPQLRDLIEEVVTTKAEETLEIKIHSKSDFVTRLRKKLASFSEQHRKWNSRENKVCVPNKSWLENNQREFPEFQDGSWIKGYKNLESACAAEEKCIGFQMKTDDEVGRLCTSSFKDEQSLQIHDDDLQNDDSKANRFYEKPKTDRDMLSLFKKELIDQLVIHLEEGTSQATTLSKEHKQTLKDSKPPVNDESSYASLTVKQLMKLRKEGLIYSLKGVKNAEDTITDEQFNHIRDNQNPTYASLSANQLIQLKVLQRQPQIQNLMDEKIVKMFQKNPNKVTVNQVNGPITQQMPSADHFKLQNDQYNIHVWKDNFEFGQWFQTESNRYFAIKKGQPKWFSQQEKIEKIDEKIIYDTKCGWHVANMYARFRLKDWRDTNVMGQASDAELKKVFSDKGISMDDIRNDFRDENLELKDDLVVQVKLDIGFGPNVVHWIMMFHNETDGTYFVADPILGVHQDFRMQTEDVKRLVNLSRYTEGDKQLGVYRLTKKKKNFVKTTLLSSKIFVVENKENVRNIWIQNKENPPAPKDVKEKKLLGDSTNKILNEAAATEAEQVAWEQVEPPHEPQRGDPNAKKMKKRKSKDMNNMLIGGKLSFDTPAQKQNHSSRPNESKSSKDKIGSGL